MRIGVEKALAEVALSVRSGIIEVWDESLTNTEQLRVGNELRTTELLDSAADLGDW